MTTPEDPARLAELERQLAHAMGEVARLKEQAGEQGAAPVYEPYAPDAGRPEPTVTVDGAPVAAGDGRLAEAVRRGGGVVVQVDGHTVPVDSPESWSRVFGSGVFADLQQWLVTRPVEKHGFLPDPDRVERLVPAPRPVPVLARLGTMVLGPVGLFVMFMLAISPMALWILVPGALPTAATLGAVLLGARCARLHQRRASLLRWGEVATVTAVRESTGSSSYTNVPMRRARGWDARWESYTGPGRRTEVDYRVGATSGTLRLGGAPYDGGVVLADPRRPGTALCVSQLWSSVKPGPDGHLPRGLSAVGLLGVALTLGLLVAMVVVAGVSWVALVR